MSTSEQDVISSQSTTGSNSEINSSKSQESTAGSSPNLVVDMTDTVEDLLQRVNAESDKRMQDFAKTLATSLDVSMAKGMAALGQEMAKTCHNMAVPKPPEPSNDRNTGDIPVDRGAGHNTGISLVYPHNQQKATSASGSSTITAVGHGRNTGETAVDNPPDGRNTDNSVDQSTQNRLAISTETQRARDK